LRRLVCRETRSWSSPCSAPATYHGGWDLAAEESGRAAPTEPAVRRAVDAIVCLASTTAATATFCTDACWAAVVSAGGAVVGWLSHRACRTLAVVSLLLLLAV
jgi:hypothetical protein